MNKLYFQRGFTLIELLVVIAIIGILASVVIGAVNISREKSQDAAVKSDLKNALSQSAIYYDQSQNYGTDPGDIIATNDACSMPNTLFDPSAPENISNIIISAQTTAGGAVQALCSYGVDGVSWAAYVPLKRPEIATTGWCVDSLGTSKASTALVADFCP